MGSYFEKVATTELKGIIVAVSEKVVLMYEEPSANQGIVYSQYYVNSDGLFSSKEYELGFALTDEVEGIVMNVENKFLTFYVLGRNRTIVAKIQSNLQRTTYDITNYYFTQEIYRMAIDLRTKQLLTVNHESLVFDEYDFVVPLFDNVTYTPDQIQLYADNDGFYIFYIHTSTNQSNANTEFELLYIDPQAIYVQNQTIYPSEPGQYELIHFGYSQGEQIFFMTFQSDANYYSYLINKNHFYREYQGYQIVQISNFGSFFLTLDDTVAVSQDEAHFFKYDQLTIDTNSDKRINSSFLDLGILNTETASYPYLINENQLIYLYDDNMQDLSNEAFQITPESVHSTSTDKFYIVEGRNLDRYTFVQEGYLTVAGIVGIVFGVIVLFVLIAGLCYFIKYLKNRQRQGQYGDNGSQQNERRNDVVNTQNQLQNNNRVDEVDEENIPNIYASNYNIGGQHKLKRKFTLVDLQVNEQEAKDKTCSICLCEECHVYLPCKHFFHRTCIEDWLKKSVDCPCCRTESKAQMVKSIRKMN